MSVESTLPRPKTTKKPATEKTPPVVDPRDAGREAEILDAIDQLEHARLAYADDECLPAAVWARAFALVITVDAGRIPPAAMPLISHVEDLAKSLDDAITKEPDIDWNVVPIENWLCGMLDRMNQLAAQIMAPPEAFDMREFVRERLQEKGRDGNTPVTIPQIARMTGLPDSEIKKFRDDPASVDWTGRELPATLETEQAKRAAAAKFNSGRGLSTFASKFIACGFSASPSPEG
jgi:hypothetical protein